MNLLEDYVFHYTDASSILSIITKRKLWATDIGFLNDRKEGGHVNDCLKIMASKPYIYFGSNYKVNEKYLRALECHLRSGRQVTIVSFSKHKGTLPQFRMYCPPAGGYVIGFPIQYLQEIGRIVECDYDKKNLIEWCRGYFREFVDLAKIADGENKTPESLSEEIHNSSNLFERRVEASLKFKSPEFRAEDEVRLLSYGGGTNFRPSRSGNYIVPYQEIDLPNSNVQVAIAAGPSRDQALAQNTLNYVLPAARSAGTNWGFLLVGGGTHAFREN